MDVIAFASGFSYGLTSVIVGQPLDTIKTRMQTVGSNASMLSVGKDIFAKEGLYGLYRGGMSLIIGGALIRSTQFGVNSTCLELLRRNLGQVQQKDRIFGIFDYQIILAGLVGGVGRGVVEGPFEYIKVRRQVEQKWKFKEIFKGSGATIFRNSILFCSFMIYIDLSKQIVPGGLGSFLTGAICSNMAWFTIWPLDVVKSQVQSGKYEGVSYWTLLKDIHSKGLLFRGVLPGLLRSFIANGISMVAYDKTSAFLKKQLNN